MFANVLGIAVRSGKGKTTQQRQANRHGRDDRNQHQNSIPRTTSNEKFKSMLFSAISKSKIEATAEEQYDESVVLVPESDLESDLESD